jgi:hypothetical protein
MIERAEHLPKERRVAVDSDELLVTFRKLADTWSEETGGLSLIQKKVQHSAYQQIIALGPDAVPLILRELEREPDHWFWALAAITGENPVQRGMTFDDAVAAWIVWGRSRGLIA